MKKIFAQVNCEFGQVKKLLSSPGNKFGEKFWFVSFDVHKNRDMIMEIMILLTDRIYMGL